MKPVETLAALGAAGMLSRDQREDLGAMLLQMAFRAVWAAVYAHHVRFSDADDLIGDTVLAAWRRLGTYDSSRGSLATWVGAVARSRIADFYRRRQRDRVVLDTLSGRLVCLTTLDPPPDIAADADALCEWDEQLGRWMSDTPSVTHIAAAEIEHLARDIGRRHGLPSAAFTLADYENP